MALSAISWKPKLEKSFFRRGAAVLNKPDYVPHIGLLRILEKRILKTADISRIIDAPSPEEAMRLIGSASEYDFSALRFPEQYEQVLRPAQLEIYERCRAMSPDAETVDIAACRYLFHNLKTAVKAKLTGSSDDGVYSDISVSDFSTEDLRRAVFGDAVLPDYLAEAVRESIEDYERYNNPQAIDVAIDKAQLKRQLELSQKLKSEFITSYIKKSIDYYNLLTTLRAKEMRQPAVFLERALADGGILPTAYFSERFTMSIQAMASNFSYRYFGKTTSKGIEAYQRVGNFSQLEKLLDDDLVAEIRKSKMIAFGPETVFSYLLAKENEIRQIRIIMAAKINKLSAARLSERLRENYV